MKYTQKQANDMHDLILKIERYADKNHPHGEVATMAADFLSELEAGKYEQPKKKSLLQLAKDLDFRTETEYFNYCINSYINGNFSQCKKLFNAMTKAGRKALIVFIGSQDAGTNELAECEAFYFNLL